MSYWYSLVDETLAKSTLSSCGRTHTSHAQLTGITDYLNRSEICFKHVTRDWTEDTCGGGKPNLIDFRHFSILAQTNVCVIYR